MAAVALVRVVEAHPNGGGTVVADAQLDLEVVGIVATSTSRLLASGERPPRKPRRKPFGPNADRS